MNTHDWLQGSHEALYNQSTLTANYLSLHTTRFGIEGADLIFLNQFTTAQRLLVAAYNQWVNPATRTPLITSELKTAEKTFIPLYRKLYTGLLKGNPNITDTDMIAMGLPPHNTVDRPTASPVPDSYPQLEVQPSDPRTVRVLYHDSASGKKAHPHGVAGAVFRWDIRDTPPDDVLQLSHTTLDTKSPLELTFNETQRGKTVYIIAAWQNTRGVTGKWSNFVSAIIP